MSEGNSFNGDCEMDSDAEEERVKLPRRRHFLSSSDEENDEYTPLSETEKVDIFCKQNECVTKINIENQNEDNGNVRKLICQDQVKSHSESSNDEVGLIQSLSNDESDHDHDGSNKVRNVKEEIDICAKTKKEKATEKTKRSTPQDGKLVIRSETQRMIRETSASLPYHRPKQRGLKEFLSRRKHVIPVNCLRSTSSRMVDTWVEVDEEIKEIVEFFKSESEDENEEEILVNVSKDLVNDSSTVNIPIETIVEGKDLVTTMNEEGSIEQIINCNDGAVLSCDPGVSINDKEKGSNSCNLQIDINNDKTQGDYNSDKENNEEVHNILEKTPDGKDKTSEWLHNIKLYEKKESIKKRLLLSPSILNCVPTLSDPSADFISLTSPNKSTIQPGALKLMEKLCYNRPIQVNKEIEVTTTSMQRNDEGEIVDIAMDKVVVSSNVSEIILEDGTPGNKFKKFRDKLLSKIEGKWEKDFKQRCAEVLTVEKHGFEDAASDVDDFDEEEFEDEFSSESEPEEDDVLMEDKPRAKCDFGDSEAEESEDNDNDGDDGADVVDEDGSVGDITNDEMDEEEECNYVDDCESSNKANDTAFDINEKEKIDEEDIDSLPPYQPGGVVSSMDISPTPTQPPTSLNVLSPPLSLIELTPRAPASPNKENNTNLDSPTKDFLTPDIVQNLFSKESPKKLFDTAEPTDSDDPYLFISGAFPDSAEMSSQPNLKKTFQQNDDVNSESHMKDELLDEVITEMNSTIPPVVVSRRFEEESESARSVGSAFEDEPTTFKGILSAKKKRKKLVYSDDEDNDNHNEDLQNEGEESDIDDEEPKEVDYDSEENEIPIIKPSEFFENEAELSESEWSGDEDERDLDKMDAEAGDADQLDEEQVASQLGRIHMRRLLDDDARDVRLIQEILFEDGDLHGEGKERIRKFKWKNLSGFDRDDARNLDSDDSDDEGGKDEANLAKLRHEKAQLLLQMEKEGKLADIEESSSENSLLQMGKRLLEKIQNKTIAKVPDSKFKRRCGSFLSKDSAFLSKIAKATGNEKEALGPVHSRNFVFSAQTPEQVGKGVNEETVKSMKRKATSCQDTVKKAKITPKFSSTLSILDQLI